MMLAGLAANRGIYGAIPVSCLKPQKAGGAIDTLIRLRAQDILVLGKGPKASFWSDVGESASALE
jgi:hypothetical protein